MPITLMGCISRWTLMLLLGAVVSACAEGAADDTLDIGDGPASRCYDQDQLQVSYSQVDEEYPCLRAYCASITTAAECNSDASFAKGCGWCGGSCTPFMAYQQAYVSCVRDAYADHEPDRVNGKQIPGIISVPEQTSLFNGSVGPPISYPGVSDDLSGDYRWDLSEVSREEGYRVPIHMHPFGGLICVLEGSEISMFVEGEADVTGIEAGDCYAMPADRKMGTYCGGPGGYRDRDTFRTNVCYPTWVVLEPEGYFVQDEEFVFTSDIVCE